jgi:hypothetical protein
MHFPRQRNLVDRVEFENGVILEKRAIERMEAACRNVARQIPRDGC